MASTPSTPRRGLPRVPGGEPWPPAGSDAPGEAGPEGASAGVATGSLEVAAGSPGAVAGVSPDGADRPEFRPGAARIAADSEDRPTDAAESGVAVASGAAAGVSQDGADLAEFRPGAARIAADSEDRPTDAADAVAQADTASDPTAAPAARPAAGPAAGPDTVTVEPSAPAETAVRRGLPREPGGEPWPPASSDARTQDERPAAPEAGQRGEIGAAGGADSRPASTPGADPAARNESDAEPGASSTPPDAATTGFRRGLPRESGGEPWPPASAPVTTGRDVPLAAVAESAQGGVVAGAASPGPHPVGVSDLAAAGSAATGARSTTPGEADAATRAAASTDPEQAARSAFERSTPRPPLTVPRTVWPGAAARRAASARAAARAASATAASATAAARPAGSPSAAAGRSAAPGATRLADFSPVQLLGSTAVLGVFALALVGIAVLLARFVLALEPGREFLAAYPGEYHLPESAPVGLPAWLNWSHFLNSFFLLFIIRTGWQVRNEKRPAAFWSPRKNKRRRISLTLWFHQAIDILWIANGVVYVVLLFTTGQWMRIVPTSWEVFPNALSAALQYASLDWPTENGWVNYNSLQQLSYFAITFVAAPLAIFSGVRLSGVWPKDAEKLNRLYPIEWARKVHFPTMLFFVAFIVVHVALVLATGALRNLNHMYAARGSVDPGAYTSDPTGLLIFAASLLVMAAGWVAARPRVLVPIARLFGDVKQR